MAIYQDLVSLHGFTAKYASVRRFVRRLTGGTLLEARAIIQTTPGEETQVDYGDGPMVRDVQTGKYRRTRLFVLTLGYSRKCVRLITGRSSSHIWAALHEQAFRRLGGSVRVIVLDNLKEGVLTPDIYDPALNPLYRDLLRHYGVTALPCRVGDPDRKGKVESSVGHAQRTPLKGLRFETVEDAQRYLDHWEERWAEEHSRRMIIQLLTRVQAALGLLLNRFRQWARPSVAPSSDLSSMPCALRRRYAGRMRCCASSFARQIAT
jgi:transposase